MDTDTRSTDTDRIRILKSDIHAPGEHHISKTS